MRFPFGAGDLEAQALNLAHWRQDSAQHLV